MISHVSFLIIFKAKNTLGRLEVYVSCLVLLFCSFFSAQNNLHTILFQPWEKKIMVSAESGIFKVAGVVAFEQKRPGKENIEQPSSSPTILLLKLVVS